MSNWKNNEDAGDLAAMNAADASELHAWCIDCENYNDECDCGTDPDEYPQDAADVAYEEEYGDDNYSDAEADADTLASAGMGTDEDYGYYNDGEEW